MSHTRFLQGYYLGTPVFSIADLAFNAPIRVSFGESSINLLLLMLSTMINVLICGSVLVLTFHRSEAAILVGKGGRRN